MKEERINEAMAKLDGFTYKKLWPSGRPRWNPHPLYSEVNVSIHPPKYTESHDAVQLVIDGLDDEEVRHEGIFTDLEYYSFHIVDICIPEKSHHKATASQKCKALLRAKGLWEESE